LTPGVVQPRPSNQLLRQLRQPPQLAGRILSYTLQEEAPSLK